MRFIFAILTLMISAQALMAQKLIAKAGHIGFYSYTPVEDIEAHNRQVVSILDPSNGSLQFSLLIKSFEFEKKLMQEHFNENYMESDTYPKATFSGIISNFSTVDIGTDGSYDVDVTGDLTIHGVTKKINTKGTIHIKNKVVSATAKFIVAPSDYAISIPSLVEKNIAKEIEVNVNVTYQ